MSKLKDKQNPFKALKHYFFKLIYFHKEKATSSRLMSHMTQTFWQMYGKEQAKTMLYYNGRIVGRQMIMSVKNDYKTKNVLDWEDFLAKLEVYGSFFSVGKVTVTSFTDDTAVVRFWNSPCCNVSVVSDSFCCDFVAGFLAALPAFSFEGVDSKCKEIACKGYDKSKKYCDFLLEVNWSK